MSFVDAGGGKSSRCIDDNVEAWCGGGGIYCFGKGESDVVV